MQDMKTEIEKGERDKQDLLDMLDENIEHLKKERDRKEENDSIKIMIEKGLGQLEEMKKKQSFSVKKI